MIFIAEVKTQSPFGFKSPHSFSYLLDIAIEYGDWVSIHTDPRWGGNYDNIKRVRQITTKPILAKGLHSTEDEVMKAFNSGADYVLSVVNQNYPTANDHIIYEPSSIEHMVQYNPFTKVCWNSRDLNDGLTKPQTIYTARKRHKGWLCQASMIQRINDIHPFVDAFIVGEHLPDFVKEL